MNEPLREPFFLTGGHRGDSRRVAGAIRFHLAENQPFVDGNKRAALGAGLTFLRLNGYDVDDPEERLYAAMIAIAKRELDKGGLADLLRTLAHPVAADTPAET